MKKSFAEKIADIDRRIARWQPRFTRANNEMTRLLRIRARVLKEAGKAEPVRTLADRPRSNALHGVVTNYDAIEAQAKELVGEPIPDFLRRGQAAQAAVNKIIEDHNKAVETDHLSEPEFEQLADKLKKRRAKATEEAKHKMPLNEREAMKHIKRRK